MADQEVYTDPNERTFLYIMYVQSVTLTPEMAEFEDSTVVCRWYVDSSNDCSKPFVLSLAEPARTRYCSFLVISTGADDDRSRSVTMTMSHPDGAEHIAVAFLDLASLSREDVFKVDTVELRNQAGVVAVAELHTASQQRWSYSPVEPQAEGYYVDHNSDDQAKLLHYHIVGEDDDATPQADDGQQQAEAEEARRKAEAEEEKRKEEERRRQEAEAQEKERERKRKADEEAEKDRRRKEEEAKEQERKKKEEEDAERERRKKQEEEEAKQQEQKRQEEERRRRELDEEKEREREREREKEKEKEKEREREREREKGIGKGRGKGIGKESGKGRETEKETEKEIGIHMIATLEMAVTGMERITGGGETIKKESAMYNEQGSVGSGRRTVRDFVKTPSEKGSVN